MFVAGLEHFVNHRDVLLDPRQARGHDCHVDDQNEHEDEVCGGDITTGCIKWQCWHQAGLPVASESSLRFIDASCIRVVLLVISNFQSVM